MEDTPSFRGVPIRYFRAQDGVLQICLKEVMERWNVALEENKKLRTALTDKLLALVNKEC